jgi:hypothetical protein
LILKGNHDDEVKDLLEEVLELFVKKGGDDGEVVATAIFCLCKYHISISNKLPHGDRRIKQRYIAEKYCQEALRISTKTYGSNHPKTLFYETDLLKIRNYSREIAY